MGKKWFKDRRARSHAVDNAEKEKHGIPIDQPWPMETDTTQVPTKDVIKDESEEVKDKENEPAVVEQTLDTKDKEETVAEPVAVDREGKEETVAEPVAVDSEGKEETVAEPV